MTRNDDAADAHLIEALPLGVALVDDELRVVRVNAAFLRRAGVAGAVGQLISDVLTGLGPELEMMLRAVLDSRQAFLDVPFTDVTRAHRRFSVSGFPAEPRGVGILLADAAAEDREVLRDREALFHAMFDHATIGILAVEWSSQGIWINPAFTRLLGYSREELARISVQEISHPEDFEADRARFEKLMQGEIDHYELTKRYLRKDGNVMWANLMVSLARDANGAPSLVIAMIEDITARRHAEEDRQHLIEQLQHAVRARDVFLAIASHELKTPLNTLQLGLETLAYRAEKAGWPTPPELTVALRQTARLGALVEDLLDVSRLVEGRLVLHHRPFDLAGAVRDVVERLRPIAEREDCELSVTAGEPVPVTADRARIEQVLSNLIGNALKFGSGKPIEVRLAADGDHASVSVSDRGIGIAAGDHERIFLPFERAVSEMGYGGLGLGLYIASQIAQAHGGQIHVESTPGEGARFTFDLPRRGD